MPIPSGKSYVHLRTIRAELLREHPQSISSIVKKTGMSTSTITGLLSRFPEYIDRVGYGLIDVMELGHSLLSNTENVYYGRSDEEIIESVKEEMSERDTLKYLANGGLIENIEIEDMEARKERLMRELAEIELYEKNANGPSLLAQMAGNERNRKRLEQKTNLEAFKPKVEEMPTLPPMHQWKWLRCNVKNDSNYGGFEFHWWTGKSWQDYRGVPNKSPDGTCFDENYEDIVLMCNHTMNKAGVLTQCKTNLGIPKGVQVVNKGEDPQGYEFFMNLWEKDRINTLERRIRGPQSE